MKVYLVCGKARHGKDTIGNFLEEIYLDKGYKICKSQISKYLKQYIKDYFGWDGSEEKKPRQLLQQLGTDIIREKLKKERFFVDRTIEDIEILSNFFDIMIITDIRFPIEVDAIRERFDNVTVIHVERINFETELTTTESKHKTETAMDNYNKYDYCIINNELDDLKQQIMNVVNVEEKNEKIN